MKTSNKLLLGFFIAALIAVTVFFGVIKHYVNTLSVQDNFIKLPAEGKVIDVKPFTSIKVDGVYDIVLSQGTKESVTVKGDYSSFMKIFNAGNTLIVTDSEHVRFLSNTHTTVYITLVNINSLNIDGVCNTTCADTLHLKNLVFKFPGVGSTNLLLNTDSLKVKNEGTGELILAGKALYANISDDGTGSLSARKFHVNDLHVDFAGTGDVSVFASNTIYVDASGTGDVSYSGPAKVMQMNNTGTGEVRHKD
jgi:hypothetical protein